MNAKTDFTDVKFNLIKTVQGQSIAHSTNHDQVAQLKFPKGKDRHQRSARRHVFVEQMLARSYINEIKGIVLDSKLRTQMQTKRRRGFVSHTQNTIPSPTTDDEMRGTAKSFFKVFTNQNYPHQRILRSLKRYIANPKADSSQDSDDIPRAVTEILKPKKAVKRYADARNPEENFGIHHLRNKAGNQPVNFESFLDRMTMERPKTGIGGVVVKKLKSESGNP